MAGGVERVLTLKANYFAEEYGYDITIITTDGKDRPPFFPLSDRVRVINLDINYEELWHCCLLKKIPLYLYKQYQYNKLLSKELFKIRPDITISLLRREINFITTINDGSKKIGEIHINRAHYRNFTPNRSNPIKHIFSKYWMHGLVDKVKKLDRFVVLTEYDRQAWQEVPHVDVIPNPLPFYPQEVSVVRLKRVIAVGRYFDEKGYDMLLKAWAIVEKADAEWTLDIYGEGNKHYYQRIVDELQLDTERCHLNDSVADVQKKYLDSSLFVCSSRFEGFGMMLVEAMACGLPVVSFDCQWGPRSIIADGQDGLLVADGNVDALAEGLSRLMADEPLRLQMGRAARENVKRFRIDAIAARWQALFTEVCNSEKN
jgi:glycosyltransferase involved in cell wall biosynthesis